MAKKSSKRWIYLTSGALVIFFIFILIAKAQGWIGKPKTVEVALSKATIGDIVEKVSASGKIQPEKEIKIAPEVSGEITHILVKEGDSVKKGQLLLKIRPDKIQSVLDQAVASLNNTRAMAAQAEAALGRSEAQYNQAKRDFDRNADLFKQKAISQADYQTAEANFKVAKQDLESAKQNLRAANFSIVSAQARVSEAQENLYLTQIYAPESGIISKLNVEAGERVVGTSQMAGTELLTIADLQKMEVRIDVNENDIIRVKRGDTAIIDVDAYSQLDKKFKGVVTEIANTAKTTTTTDAVTEFEVKVKILKESFDYLREEKKVMIPFRPGMTASVDVMTARENDVLLIPLSAVTTRDESKTEEESDQDQENSNAREKKQEKGEQRIKEVVFLNDNGKAKLVEVKTGISDYDNIQVLSGLKKGDEVVSGPFITVSQKLKDGDLVSPSKVVTDKKKK